MKFTKDDNRGITLISLIITVIVLLILAGVSLSMVIGDNSVLTQAMNAREKHAESAAYEEVLLAFGSCQSDYLVERAAYAGKNKSDYFTKDKINEYLSGKGEIIEDFVYVDGEDTTVKYKSNNGETYNLVMKANAKSNNTNNNTVTRADWNITDDGTLGLFKGTVPSNGILEIPAEVDGIKVKKIELTEAEGRELFGIHYPNTWPVLFNAAANNSTEYYNTEVKKIIIPNGVTEIGAAAFCNMENLEIVEISDTVTKIGDYAFSGCKNLKEVIIPENNNYIGKYSFYECTALENVYIKAKSDIGYQTKCFYKTEGEPINFYFKDNAGFRSLTAGEHYNTANLSPNYDWTYPVE